jgi:rSAM/selenodomain-associated transferase 1
MTRKALLVMAKRPFPGRTKTRLASFFSTEEASALYKCFLLDALEQARSVSGVTPFVAYSPHDKETEQYFEKLAPHFQLLPQKGDTLGERLDHVLTSCLNAGYDQVAAMNSDSPSLPPAFLARAFTQMDDPVVDVVLGPCDDGGYYLIGWKRPYQRLLLEVQMSTHHVLRDTLAIADEEKLHVSLLPSWYDVDETVDMVRLQADLLSQPEAAAHTRRFLSERIRPIDLEPTVEAGAELSR